MTRRHVPARRRSLATEASTIVLLPAVAASAAVQHQGHTVRHVSVGGLASVCRNPGTLESAHGDQPVSFMVFVRSVVR